MVKHNALLRLFPWMWLCVVPAGALNEQENMVKARIEQPLNIPCLLDIKKLLHLAWYRCTTVEECRTDWVKHRIAHIEEMRDVYDDYPDRYGVKLNGTLTINKILPEDDGKIYICLGKIQFSGMVENITVVKIIEEPPEIYSSTPPETEVIEGMPLTLEAKARGWPYPSISWNRNKKVLVVNRTILRLFNATESFNGEYTFRAENRLGSKNITINVAVVGSGKPDEHNDCNCLNKTVFWALLALVLFLLLVVVILVIVIVKKFLRRHDNATPQTNGNVVNDVVDGKWDEKNGYYRKFENECHDDGYVRENILNSNYMMTTSC